MGTDGMVERTRDLFARVTEQTDSSARSLSVALICNGCGRVAVVVAPTRERIEGLLPVALVGWTVTREAEDRDLCPACTRRAG